MTNTPQENQAVLEALQCARIGYGFVTAEGILFSHNAIFPEHTGMHREGAERAEPWFLRDFAPAETKRARAALWSRIITRGSSWRGIVRWYVSEDEVRYFEGTAVPQDNGDFLLVTNDRTDRMVARRKATETEATQKVILSVLPVVLCVARENNVVDYLNEALPERLGIPVTELVGKTVEQVFGPGLKTTAEDLIRKVIAENSPFTPPTIEVVDGLLAGTHWQVSAHPFRENEQGARRVLVTAVDRTDSVRLRNERVRFSASIAETQKIEAINNFAGSLAHELSNLMQPISGYSKLLANKLTDETQKEYLTRINQATLAAGRILRRTLSMSRIDHSGQMHTNVTEVVQETIQAAKDLAPSGLTYTFSTSAADLLASCHRGELRQVLLNLLNNAAEAMHYRGTIDVRVCKEDTLPDSEEFMPSGKPPFVCICIEDQGGGISSENLQRIFDPFFTTKKAGHGTGLGLAVVQGLVTGWGGTVTATNEGRKGAVLAVRIPMDPPQP